MRYFFKTSYNGKNYHGWQIQKNAITVQKKMEEALQTVLGQSIAIVGSGRTDTGVHASGQVFHCDLPIKIDKNQLTYKLNSFLPADISINRILWVNDAANARFDALCRHYRYDLHQEKDPFIFEFSYYYRQKLNMKAMNDAAGLLLRYDDFESFSKVKTDVNHFQCRISTAYWDQQDYKYHFYIAADRFLRGMVRAIVGSLLDVGTGKIDLKSFEEIIIAKDRKKAGRAVPAKGLTLCRVDYPETLFL